MLLTNLAIRDMTSQPQPLNAADLPRKAASARDVARLAGVSVATVSLVVNEKAEGRVSTERQEQVRRAVAELGHHVLTAPPHLGELRGSTLAPAPVATTLR